MSNNDSKAILIEKYKQPQLAEAAPGKFVPVPDLSMPDRVLADMVANEDGTWRAVPIRDFMVRVDSDLLKLLGLLNTHTGRSAHMTLYRLSRAGFVEMARVAPHTYMLNIDSWFNHLRRVAEDPEFWDNGGGNIELYREAL